MSLSPGERWPCPQTVLVVRLQRILTGDGYREAGGCDANHPILQRMVPITKLIVCIVLKFTNSTLNEESEDQGQPLPPIGNTWGHCVSSILCNPTLPSLTQESSTQVVHKIK